MKKVLFTLALAASILSANAADKALTGTKFTDNWSVGLNVGATQPLTHNDDFFDNWRGQFGVEVYKQFTPVFKAGVDFSAGVNTTGVFGNRGTRTAFDTSNLSLNGGLNLMNLFGGYNGTPRLFEIEAIGGIGWGHVYTYNKVDGHSTNCMTTKVGLNFGFNLGNDRQWTLALKPAIVWNIDGRDEHNAVVFSSNAAVWEVTAGIAYHFKTSNGTHHFTYADLYNQDEIDGLNAKINQLRGDLNKKNAELKDANNTISDLNDTINNLKNRAPQVIKEVQTNNTRSMESVVTFGKGKSTVDNAQLPNVERIATYLNNHKDAKVVIRGFASPEGSQEVNERIANARAEAVKNILVKRYKINAKRIDAAGNGIGDMFSEADWNRVSVCTIDDSESK